ncbi:hypothetical protein [Hymenobacter metallicola]|uniref:Lipoprotein n=1 Tax=Hymenobacter metallicola TaxID=2563114 RepID=A0A4Z0QCV8_9BACT|nr:hypothetical protein [Hymenobacter metallicola]TGE27316.1 hypothetical protein E5K02_13075 [Hymenobacter metallicola]
MHHTLRILSLLAILASCQKEQAPDPEPGPEEHSLTRSLQFPGEGIRLDTTYTTSQIPVKAHVSKFTPQEDYLLVEFTSGASISTTTQKDIISLNIPVSKLRPGWVGDYQFVYGRFNTSPPTFTGHVMGSLYLRYHQNAFAYFDANGSADTPGVFRITAYDAKRHLISGDFRTSGEAWIDLTPVTKGAASFKLQLSGSFKNLPVKQ